jgi:hypothetical protein
MAEICRNKVRFSKVSLLLLSALCCWSCSSVSFAQGGNHHFGIVCHPTLRGADEWEHPEKIVQIYKELGVGDVIVHFSWAAMEPEKRKYSSEILRCYDDVVDRLSKANIEISAMLVRTPQWAIDLNITGKKRKGMEIFASPPKHPEDFAEFVSFFAGRYKGKISRYLFYNETNLNKRWIEPKFLVGIQKAGYAAVKNIDPKAQIVMPSLEGRPRQRARYLREFLKYGGGKYTDAYDFHMNTASQITGKTEKDAGMLLAVLKAYGEDRKPVYFGAFAVPSQYTYTAEQMDVLRKQGAIPQDYSPRTPETQARVLVTQMITARSLGVDRAYWARTRDWLLEPRSIAEHRKERLGRLRPDSFYGMNKREGHDMTMGIVNHDYSPKASFHAFKTLIAKLDGADCVKTLGFGKGKGVFFRKSNELIGVLWNAEREETVRLGVGTDKVTLFDMYGSVINAVEPREGIVNINIGPSPVYVKGAHRIPTV